MEAKQPLTPDYVYQIIQGVTKVNSSEREQSEALLKKWEQDATPGCLDSLMQIASQPAAISEVRLRPEQATARSCASVVPSETLTPQLIHAPTHQ